MGVQSSSRPLDLAVLDSIDFDIEGGSNLHGYDLARYIKGHNKQIYITVAPQCPFPDASIGIGLNTGLFDYVWVQFYNNPPYQNNPSAIGSLEDAWKLWTSYIPTNKIFLGLPASPKAAESGFTPVADRNSKLLPAIKRSAKYGRIMLWSRYYDGQTGYSSSIKSLV